MRKLNIGALALVLSLGQGVMAQTAAQAPAKPADDLTNLDVMDLAKMTVTSASKKAESIFGVATSMSVVTADDIKRFGCTNIPEALRLVPGVQVAQTSATQYAVTIRGDNALYNDKLLVLIDGRSIYNNLYGGVYWEDQAMSMDDIDRIEVIRGPGGTLWGANAVNGVINIITKQAKDTKGVFLSESGATHGTQGASTFRYGGSTAHGDFRITAFGVENEQSIKPNHSEASDESRGGKFSFRYDGGSEETGKVLLEGDYHKFDTRIAGQTPTSTLPFSVANSNVDASEGGSILAKIEKTLADGSSNSLQMTYDKTSKFVFSDVLDRDDAIDAQYQHTFRQSGNNNIIAGAEYKSVSDNYAFGGNLLNPPTNTAKTYGFFAQDEVKLNAITKFTAGTKVEHNDWSAWEVQPSARISVQPDDKQTWWGSVSRAVRTPNRAYQNGDLPFELTPIPIGHGHYAPGEVMIIGNPNEPSTDLIAVETGYRKELSKTSTIDVSLFNNAYTHYSGLKQGAAITGHSPIIIPENIYDNGSATTRGLEISSKTQVTDKLRLGFGYSYETSDMAANTFNAPKHAIKEMGSYQFSDKLSFDQAIYWDGADSEGNASYHRMDFQVTYKPTKNCDIMVGGRNLGNGQYTQIGALTLGTGGLIQPALYSQVTLKF